MTRFQAAVVSLLSATVVSAVMPVQAASLPSHRGSVTIVVRDEAGAAIVKAPVYISDGHKMDYRQTDANGKVSTDLQEGPYTISSSLVKQKADFIDRYVSPEAYIRVSAEEPTSVVLVLHPLENPIPDVSVSGLKKMGVASEVEKYIN